MRQKRKVLKMRYINKKFAISFLSLCVLGSTFINHGVIKADSTVTPTTPEVTASPVPSQNNQREMTSSAVVVNQLFYYFKTAKPVIKDNQIFIPIEEFASMLNYTVSYNTEYTKLSIKNNNKLLLTISIGESCFTTNIAQKNFLMVNIERLSELGIKYQYYYQEQPLTLQYGFQDLFVLTTDNQEPILRADFHLPRKETTVDCFTPSLSPFSNKALSLSAINIKLKKYGKVINDGLSLKEYKAAMTNVWRDVTKYNQTPKKVSVNLTKQITYKDYENMLLALSKYEGVYVYVIGKSTAGRNIYSITIDMGNNPDKKVMMFTGQTHAREFAGGSFILKQFAELIQKAQTNQSTRALLEKYKYVAVPIINVDSREEIIKNTYKYVHTSIGLWKAYINGTDGNRNYPGISANQLVKGIKKSGKIESKAGPYNYNGDYSGSNSETKAMMKWLYYYTVQEKAISLLDYHMQGRLVYGGKTWDTNTNYNRNKSRAYRLLAFLNKGNYGKYTYIKESKTYGNDGDGSTLTDFAASCALGAKYSTAYRSFVITDSKKEYSMIQYKDLDKIKGTFKQANATFVTNTIEVGAGASALGNSAYARKKLAVEYKAYHYDKLLEKLPNIILE